MKSKHTWVMKNEFKTNKDEQTSKMKSCLEKKLRRMTEPHRSSIVVSKVTATPIW